MNYYEHTLIARQNLSQKDVEEVEKKYTTLINENSGKVLKVEKWGLLNFKRKIKNYTKGYYLHYKMEGDSKTLEEIKNKIKLDNNIVRYLTVRYKKLDLKTEYFTKNKN